MDSIDMMVDDDMLLDDFYISAISLVGMDTKQEAGNIQQLDNNEANLGQFYDLENGEMFAKIEKNMTAMGKEIGGLRAENGDMKNVYGQLKEEIGEMKKAFDGLNEKIGKLAEENGELKAKLAGNGGALENIEKGIAELKALIGAKNVEFGENFRKMEEFKQAFEALKAATKEKPHWEGKR